MGRKSVVEGLGLGLGDGCSLVGWGERSKEGFGDLEEVF